MRVTLNKMAVKLWKPPFYDQDKKAPVEQELHELAVKLKPEVNLGHPLIFHGLNILQQHAVTKLEMRKNYNETGLANLKIKCAGSIQSKGKSVEISLKSDGNELKMILAGKLGIDVGRIGVVCGGRVVQGREKLDQQGVKNTDTLVIVDSEVGDEVKDISGKRRLEEGLETTWMNEYEKSGKMPNYPKEENKYFVAAMELYEMGKVELKNKNFGKALLDLLRAHAEFAKCSDEILDMEEQFSFLNIDTAWCYLGLCVIGEFLDGEKRLEDCEEKLKEKYDIHSDSGREEFLLRLHLLQGIVACHLGKTSQAQDFLKQAKMDHSILKIDSKNLGEIVGMGYSSEEAKHGLRASRGDVSHAVDQILSMRKRKEEELERRNLRNRLGKCKNGSSVNLGFYKTLVKMGYTSGVAAAALKENNNNMSLAVQMIQEEPEYLGMLVDPKKEVTEEMVASVVAMGFEADLAKKAIEEHGLEKAVEVLMDKKGEEQRRKMRKIDGGCEEKIGKEIESRDGGYFDVELKDETLYLDTYLQMLN